MEVSKDEIRTELLKHVTENTTYSIPFNGIARYVQFSLIAAQL